MNRGEVGKTRIIRIGNGLGVRFPKRMLERIGLPTRLLQAGEVGPELELRVQDDTIIVSRYQGAGLSFEERITPLLQEVGAAPVEAQELVLQAITSTVGWLTRARRARTRIAAIARETYLEHQGELEELKSRGQRIWEREDLVWHLVLHRIVSSQSEVALDPALSYDGVRERILATDDPVRRIERVLTALGGGVMYTRERAAALVRCYEQIASEGGLEAVNGKFRSLPDRRAMHRFLKRFETGPDGRHAGLYSVYDPFDELYRPDFEEQLLVSGEMRTILEKLQLFLIYMPPSPDAAGSTGPGGTDTRQSMYEQFYREVAEQAKLQPWELEQVVRRYFAEVLRAINGLADELDKGRR